MRKDLGANAQLYPMPVLIIGSFDEDGNPDLMNAAWGGISNDTQISICISDYHKTTKNILKRKAFTVSVGTADTVAGCDYVGIVSGNVVKDKVARAGFTAFKSSHVDAPLIKELPFTLECELVDYFAAQICQESGKSTVAFSPQAVKALQERSWPGNIRELRNVVERLLILGGNPVSEADVKAYC